MKKLARIGFGVILSLVIITFVTGCPNPEPNPTEGESQEAEGNYGNPDTTSPAITMGNGNPVFVHFGGIYIDAGASAKDNVDGNLTVSVENNVNTAVVGTYYVTYTVTDSSGNTATAMRTVYVVDTIIEGENQAIAIMKQPLQNYDYPIDSGDYKYYNTIGGDAGIGSGGPYAFGVQENGVLHITTQTVGGASSYFIRWHSVNETANSRSLLLDPSSAQPWPISSDYQSRLVRWYMRVKGQGDFKVELKTGPADHEVTVLEWTVNNFSSSDYIEISREIPAGTEPFKLMNLVVETNSDLQVDEIGFYVKTLKLDDLRYAFLTSMGQVLRCYGLELESGKYLVRDRTNWPLGDFDSIPGLGMMAMTVACGYDLGMIGLEDAQLAINNCITTLLAIPAHESGFLPHWLKEINGVIVRHPDSEISTVDTSLAYLSAYFACTMMAMEDQRQAVLAKIRELDFFAVTNANNEISHGFDVSGQLIGNSWTAWGGETQLVLLLAKLNDPTKNYSYQTVPASLPNSPVPMGTGFIAEIAGLFFADFGGESVGSDGYGVNWFLKRQEVFSDQVNALSTANFFGGQSAVEIISAGGYTRYHVGGTYPLWTGEDGYDSPWVAPHIIAMSGSLDTAFATGNVERLISNGLMSPLSGPAESVLLNPDDWSVKRWHSMQGVLNGFFSAIGYYHAVVASESVLVDCVYQVNQTDLDLQTAIASLFNGPPQPLTVQAESQMTSGRIMTRGNAQGQHTVLLYASQTVQIHFELLQACEATMTVRYSNDNYGNSEQVDLDFGHLVESNFIAADTGDYGYGWNNFVDSPVWGPIQLETGSNDLIISAHEGTGDGYGIEIDSITLNFVQK